tara:strand:- start:218 stop:481 length:264 start_codon:yes stop_codon:yes gene_type:complete
MLVQEIQTTNASKNESLTQVIEESGIQSHVYKTLQLPKGFDLLCEHIQYGQVLGESGVLSDLDVDHSPQIITSYNIETGLATYRAMI